MYLKALEYNYEDETIFIPSEINNEARANDIHHILCKGMGGNPLKDKERIENLIALTRSEHQDFGDIKEFMTLLLKIHRRFLQINKVPFDNDWFEEKIKMYED